MEQIEEMYQKFNLDNTLKITLEMLNDLTITQNKQCISLEVETRVHENDTDYIIEKEVVNAKLV
jgi:hypothetical protein